ncbi:uncharacterized protein BDV17DRAFT_81124 [Aspergillus undulatus]|uniref:uncharacterized protein n=1 Tax=Aspergillus undulatus TaxID=1810928 RepID=UPI003CCD9194
MSLLSLPTELLCLLPSYLDNIESFTSAASTCRTLRAAFNSTHPAVILRLAASSAPTFFSPHPYFLVASSARTVSDWALGHDDRTNSLRKAFKSGIYSLYDFILEHGGLTLDRIRQMHVARFDIINPLSDKIDKMAGKQWMKTPRFWEGGVSEAITLYTDADRATFQIIIYGELFGRSMDAFLDPGQNLPKLDMGARLDYLTYCLADEHEPNIPGVLQTDAQWAYHEDQRALQHIVRCGRWRRMWAAAIRDFLDMEFGDQKPENENLRKKLLRDALMVQGVEGMELVTRKSGVAVSERYLQRARTIKDQIGNLEKPPGVHLFGSKKHLKVAEAPDLTGELGVCNAKVWR